VPTVDLWPAFEQAKRLDPDDPVYVPTDSHWSSRGCRLAAVEIAQRVEALWPALLARGPGPTARAERFAKSAINLERLPIGGDLLKLLAPEKRGGGATMLFHRVTPPAAGAAAFSAPAATGDPNGILLLGDSHLLVWRPRQGGLADHLERELGMPLAQIAVQAGGPAASRQALARREGALAGRKLVIWVFAARLLASRPMPVVRPAPAAGEPQNPAGSAAPEDET
jgi:hypothetical protein